MKLITCYFFLLLYCLGSVAETKWGADYFPNHELTNHEGETFLFFDDLVKDKIVVINFIYTSCPDVCPLETAQLTRVQRILGDRLGQDVFFYSITIDPDRDNPTVLKDYRDRFGAKWPFFTGDEAEIIDIRRKLGLYIEDIGGGENNHNISMIIGNQKTGRWMRRSPFENPYVLADQIGNWLTGWSKAQEVKNYANAPKLRKLLDGENLFRTRCISCHSIDGDSEGDIGPDLLGVTEKRDRQWLIRWLKEPDVMLANKDPLAMQLFEQYNRVPMPNMGLTQVDVMDLLKFMSASNELAQQESQKRDSEPAPDTFDNDVVAVANAWVREALPGAQINAGYMTLINITHADLELVAVHAENFKQIEIHNMSMQDGSMSMKQLASLTIPKGGQAKLAPGGLHLMLIDPIRELYQGDTISLSLQFENGHTQSINVKVLNK